MKKHGRELWNAMVNLLNNSFVNSNRYYFKTMLIKTDQTEIQNYLVDASNYKGNCDEVFFPETKADIISILKSANTSKQKVTICGNRTGLTGGCVPNDGILISTDKLNRITEINEIEKYAIVQPGVLLSEFIKLVEEKELFYPPDPTEKDCYIGGTVSTNASGAKTFKYGPTRNFVTALEIILPDGEEVYLERGKLFARDNNLRLTSKSGKQIEIILPQYQMPKTKHAAGYFIKENMDAIDLFIGSEGTLGFITEIKLKLLDKPKNILSSVIFFNDESDGLNFIENARNESYKNRNENLSDNIDALALEYFDENTLKFLVEDFPNIPGKAQAAVWFEQEFEEENEEQIFNKWIELIEKHNGDVQTAWFANNENDRKQFGEFRHAVAWKVNEYISRNNILKVGTDIAVPDSSFREFYFFAKEKVKESGINQIAYGHFGNSHLHLNMLPKNEEQYSVAKNIYAELCREGVKLNGTISAEHGIGKLKREYLLMMFGEQIIKQMAKLKKQIDPNLILNYGNIIDPKYYENI